MASLYLIPNTLGDVPIVQVLPEYVVELVKELRYYIVENEKSARRFVKKVAPNVPQSKLIFEVLDKRSEALDITNFLNPIEEGHSIGVLSEAGVPGVADPGALIVALAHKKDIKVVPLVGPSSILMAVMASGLNGQSFTFNGYLPIDKIEFKKKVKQLENLSFHTAQLFIETPYRNNKIFTELLRFLNPNTLLSIAVDITLDSEFIKTKSVAQWKKETIDFHKRPAIFMIQA